MRSLRARLTVLTVAFHSLVLGTAGYVLDRQIVDTERSAFDTRMERTLRLSQDTATATVLESLPERDSRLDAVLRADDSTLRLKLAGRVLVQTGAPLRSRAIPGGPRGFATVEIGGSSFRVLRERIADKALGQLAELELISSLELLEERESERRTRIAFVLVATLLFAALGTAVSARFVLAPLTRLRQVTAEIAEERDLARRVGLDRGSSEVRELGRSFDLMLGSLEQTATERERALAATKRFTADVGHELRTPMTAIGASIELLGRSDLTADQREQISGDAAAQQRRFVELLDGLSALARGDARSVEREPVDVVAVARDAVGEHQEGTRIRLSDPEDSVWIFGWEPGLRLVLDNLIRNALLHGGDGVIHVSVAETDGSARVVVEDAGPGVPPEHRERIFNPFARLEPGAPGAGLGLAIVAQQVAHHGGTIEVDRSAVLGGARFSVVLPMLKEDALQ